MKPNAAARDDERIDQLLAELDEGASASANSAVRELHQELARLSDELRQAPEPDLHEQESACRRAAELVAALGRDPSPETISAAKDALPALGAIGPYKLLAKLGQGGMGTVYKALHTRLEKVVALKVLPADRLRDRDAVARFEREMRAVGKLDHPNIVRANDAGDADGTHFLVMEYVEGVDLGSLIKQNGPLGIGDACELVRQAALGLQAAHSRGMVHRDIKPRNVMLAAQEFGMPVVKVLDLGLARLSVARASEAGDLTETGHIMGTIDYMAPEQAGDAHSVDIRADVYGLGATLYALLTGGSIFEGRPYKTFMQKLSALGTEPVPPIRERRGDVAEELATIVHRMLATDPTERLASPAAVAEALEPFAAGADLVALLAALPIEFGESAATGPAVTRTRPAPGSPDEAVERDSREETVPHQTALQETLPEELAPKVAVGSQRQRRDSTPWLRRPVAAVAVGVAGILVLAAILLSLRTPYGEVVVELPDDVPAEWAQELKIEVRGDGDVQVVDAASGWSIDVKKGKYAVQLAGGDDRFAIEENSVTVVRGKKTFVRVTVVPPLAPSGEGHGGERAPIGTETGGERVAADWTPAPEQQAFLDSVAKLPAEEQVAAVEDKLREVNEGWTGNVTYKTPRGDAVTLVGFTGSELRDLWPVAALVRLKVLECAGTSISDLSPLAGMALTNLNCSGTQVADLAPLTGMPLAMLRCIGTPVSDLAPLEGMPLTYLDCHVTSVADLSPLAGMKLKTLNVEETQITDLSPLEGMPLEWLGVSEAAARNHEPILREMTTLLLLNGLPAAEFWSPWEPTPEQQAFLDAVAQVDAERQADAVERQLKQVNPRWNGMLEYTIDGDDVSRVRLTGPALRDFWPIVALGRLKELDCSGSGLDSLTHVGQLRRLESLDCSRTSVRDLRPIAHLRFLSQFDCSETGVYDLSPLKLVPLRELRCFFVTAYNEKAIDALAVMGTLETVNGLTLDQLSARRTEVEELARSQPAYSPEEQLARVVELLKKFNPDYDGVVAKHEIQGGRLVLINLVGARISDLSPLRALADLRAVNCGATQVADLSPLAGLPLLHLTCGATPVADLSPLKGMSLTAIQCGGTRVADLSPLKGMPLTSVNCISTPVSDLSPLAGMPLTNLGCHDTLISDLAPLKGMPLTVFSCGMTQVSDLSPLAGMPLTSLGCGWSRVSDLSPLAGMPLEWLECREEILRKHAPLLREMATLKTINERPAEEFWRELDQGQGSGDNREVPDR